MTTTGVDGVAAADWDAVAAELDEHGCALRPRLLTERESTAIAALYDEPGLFRSTSDMRRYCSTPPESFTPPESVAG